jgi:GT2 family glycosyltransferase
MVNLFNDLMISSPNQNGGLFFLSGREFIKVDSFGTCGISAAGKYLARGIQPDVLVIYANPPIEIKKEKDNFYDIHDVLFFENHYYIVSTQTNEIIKLDQQGEEVRRWGFPGEEDSMHINCIAIWNNKIVFSAFGDFKIHRGYKADSHKSGYIKDLYTGETLIAGLSQPHSMMQYKNNLILANSETGEIFEYSPAGNFLRSKKLDGYTRGLEIKDGILYIGISKTRNVSDVTRSRAALFAVDVDTFEVVDFIDAPFDEVYSIVSVQDIKLVKYFDVFSEYALKRQVDKMTVDMEVALKTELDTRQAEFELTIQEIDNKWNGLHAQWDAHRTELETAIYKIKNEKNDIQEAKIETQKIEYELKLSNLFQDQDSKINTLKENYTKELHAVKETHCAELNAVKDCYEAKILKINAEADKLTLANNQLQSQLLNVELNMERSLIDANKKMLEKEILWFDKAAATKLDHDVKTALLQSLVSEKKETLHYQNLVLSETKSNSKLYAEQVDSLLSTVTELNAQLLTQDVLIHSQECHILELEMAVESKVQQMDRELIKLKLVHEAGMNKIFTSHSWKFTAPLRNISRSFSKFKINKKQGILNTYRKLPISLSARKNTKSFLFKNFSVFFARSSMYLNWKAYQDLQEMSLESLVQSNKQLPAIHEPVAVLTEEGNNYLITKNLKPADGNWEWEAYSNTKNVMRQIRKKMSSIEPAIPHLIDIKGSSLEEILNTIKLPELQKQPLVSIILPVYNNIKLTLECILSIQQYSGNAISYEIILADDASTDETEDILGRVSNIKYIRNQCNLGFLRNCNNALPYAVGTYTIYLNNDVQVTEGWLEQLRNTFSLYPDVGAVGPKFIYPSGHLQEAGAAFNPDGTSTMIGLNENPVQERFSYTRRVDYVSGACLMLPTVLAKKLGGFSEEFLPCYCEDSDLCLRIEKEGYFIYCNPSAVLIHHLSKTTAAIDDSFKMKCIANNVQKLKSLWSERLQKSTQPRVIALYLPQFHPFPENDKWWGAGFTEWTNVAKAKPNFVGHYQPRLPADLGYYDLRLPEIMAKQAEMAKQYGVGGFCFYYYWFDGKRLLERPIEQLLLNKSIDFPFCVCWANENWTRRWDGQEHDVLMAQAHSAEDDKAVILDLIRYFKDERYIKIDGKPLLVVYRVTLFPDFKATAALWRNVCVEEGIGEIYIAMVESFDLVHTKTNPNQFGCDAAIEFPPQGLADQKAPSGEIINPEFVGAVADYKSLAIRYATREQPAYTRFMGAMPGWDNTARRQNNSFCFEHPTPGAFQAWLEEIFEQTRLQHYGDERVVFINAWNEWAEGAYLEPDKRFGHGYLEAVKNALDANKLLTNNSDC